MLFRTISYDNIVDNNQLIDDKRKPHPALTSCIPHFFDSAEAVCLDFASVTITDRKVFGNILAVADAASSRGETRVPYILAPLSKIKHHLGKGAVWCENKISFLAVGDDGSWEWFGPASSHVTMLNHLLETGSSISGAEARQQFGEPSKHFLEEQYSKGCFITRSRQGRYSCSFTRTDLQRYLEDDASRKIWKGLLDSDSLLRHGHFVIEDSIHTDTVLLVERLLKKSSRSVEKLLVCLRDAASRYEFEAVVYGRSLGDIGELIAEHLQCRAEILDAANADDFAAKSRIPESSRVLLVDSFIRTGKTIDLMRQVLARSALEIVGAIALFGLKDMTWVRDLHCGCRSLFVLPSANWTGDTCPLCASNVSVIPVKRGTLEQLLAEAKPESHAKAYHFWQSVLATSCVKGNGSEHYYDSRGHHFTVYFDMKTFLSDENVLSDVAQHLYARLVSSFRERKISLQSIRHLVFKENDAAAALAMKLSEALDGWLQLHSVRSDYVKAMQLDPEDWPEELHTLSSKLQDGKTIVIDDGINRGWTVESFLHFFECTAVNHVATLVAINRMTDPSDWNVGNAMLAEYYCPSIPMWDQAGCPVCMQDRQVQELLRAKLPHDVEQTLREQSARLASTPL